MNLRSHRLNTVAQSLRMRVMGGSLLDWMLNTLGPGREAAARRCFTRVEEDGAYWEIEIEGVPGKLTVSREVPLHSIQQAFYEQCYAWHWHNYQVSQTTVTATDTVFDCGCAEGMFAFLNQDKAGRIVCFEPLPEFQVGLQRTFAGNPKIEIVGEALGERVQEAYLQRAGMASAVTYTPTDTKVLINTIDNYCAAKGCDMTYLKADLEGYELQVLAGAKETIRRCRPKIAITTYHMASHAREIQTFLQGLVPSYNFQTKGVEPTAGAPVMLHAW